MSVESSPIASMPDELMFQVLSYLEPRSLAKCAQVGKDWNRLTNDDRIWQRLFPNALLPDTEVRAFIGSGRTVKKWEEVVERFQAFADSLPFYQNAQFSCFFPDRPDYTITSELKYDSASSMKHEICLCFGAVPQIGDESRLIGQRVEANGVSIETKVQGIGLPLSVEKRKEMASLLNSIFNKHIRKLEKQNCERELMIGVAVSLISWGVEKVYPSGYLTAVTTFSLGFVLQRTWEMFKHIIIADQS